MPKSRPVSNPLALAVLVSLAERPMYAYEITTTLRERGKQDSIRLNFGSLYAVIRSLESNGFIAPARTEREGNRPERVVYEITPAGRTEATDWMRDLLSRPAKEYPDFEAGLSLIAILSPAETKACLDERLTRLDAEIAGRDALNEETSRAIPELLLVESYYRVAMLRAERAFVADVARRIGDGTFGGVGVWKRMHDDVAAGVPREEVAARIEAQFQEAMRNTAQPTPQQKPAQQAAEKEEPRRRTS